MEARLQRVEHAVHDQVIHLHDRPLLLEQDTLHRAERQISGSVQAMPSVGVHQKSDNTVSQLVRLLRARPPP